MNDTDAVKIAEELLDRTGRALMTGDFDLPHCAQTRDDLRDVFDSVRRYFASVGVERLDRHVVYAKAEDDKTINYVYEARLMNGDTPLKEPYLVYTTARLTQEGWQIEGSSFAIPNDRALSQALAHPKPNAN